MIIIEKSLFFGRGKRMFASADEDEVVAYFGYLRPRYAYLTRTGARKQFCRRGEYQRADPAAFDIDLHVADVPESASVGYVYDLL